MQYNVLSLKRLPILYSHIKEEERILEDATYIGVGVQSSSGCEHMTGYGSCLLNKSKWKSVLLDVSLVVITFMKLYLLGQ